MVLLSARMDQSSMHQKLDPMRNEIVQDFSPFGRFNDITALQADSFSIKILMLASFCFQ